MKTTLLFAAGLLLCTSGFSQNVGIGTTNPVFKLDVRNGSINADSVYRIGTITVLAVPGTSNLFVGKDAGRINTGSNNTFSGNQAGYYNTGGSYNTFSGDHAGYNNTTAFQNSFFGQGAGYYNTTGGFNSFFGQWAGYINTTGYYNSFFGTLAGYNNSTGGSNSFFGLNAGYNNSTGGSNSFFGQNAGYYNTTGFNNTAVGNEAMSDNKADHNTAVGYHASLTTTTGFQNTALGANSLINNTTGSYNTSVGYNTGPNNINYSNTTCLGIDASATGSDMVRIGNIFVASIGGFQNWTTFPSDGRFKQNVNEDVPGLSFVMKLRPVTYTLDVDGINQSLGIKESKIHSSSEGSEAASSTVHSGFIAQEVETAARLIGYNFSGVDAPKNSKDHYGLRYAEFVVPLVKAVQEQQSIIETLQKQVEAAKVEIPMQIGKQQAMIEQQNTIIEQQNKKIELFMKEMTLIKEKMK